MCFVEDFFVRGSNSCGSVTHYADLGPFDSFCDLVYIRASKHSQIHARARHTPIYIQQAGTHWGPLTSACKHTRQYTWFTVHRRKELTALSPKNGLRLAEARVRQLRHHKPLAWTQAPLDRRGLIICFRKVVREHTLYFCTGHAFLSSQFGRGLVVGNLINRRCAHACTDAHGHDAVAAAAALELVND